MACAALVTTCVALAALSLTVYILVSRQKVPEPMIRPTTPPPPLDLKPGTKLLNPNSGSVYGIPTPVTDEMRRYIAADTLPPTLPKEEEDNCVTETGEPPRPLEKLTLNKPVKQFSLTGRQVTTRSYSQQKRPAPEPTDDVRNREPTPPPATRH
ncbi:MAG: hypothetical protein WAZ14_03670 [Patescibacteria group bacterium]